MESTTHEVTTDKWVAVTNDASGSLFLQKGGEVALTQAIALPTTSISETALLDAMNVFESKVYYGILVVVLFTQEPFQQHLI